MTAGPLRLNTQAHVLARVFRRCATLFGFAFLEGVCRPEEMMMMMQIRR